MGQTLLNTFLLPQNNYAVQPEDLTLTVTSTSPLVNGIWSSDPINGNYFVPTGNEILLVWNTDTVAHDFTMVSVPDHLGRGDDLVYSVDAGAIAAWQLSILEGWVQPDGQVYLNPSNAHILFAVLVKQ